MNERRLHVPVADLLGEALNCLRRHHANQGHSSVGWDDIQQCWVARYQYRPRTRYVVTLGATPLEAVARCLHEIEVDRTLQDQLARFTPPSFVLVDGDDWEGLYKDGALVAQGHHVQTEMERELGYDKVLVDQAWLEARGSLPERFEDVVLERPPA